MFHLLGYYILLRIENYLENELIYLSIAIDLVYI